VSALVDRDGRDLEPPFAADHEAAVAAGDAGLALRAVVDQVAGLTDARAVWWAAELGVAAAVGATT